MDEPPGDDEPDYAGLVRGLLEDLAGTSITSLELRQGELRVALRRVPGAGGVSPATEATVVENGSLVEAGQPLLYVEPGQDDDALPPGTF